MKVISSGSTSADSIPTAVVPAGRLDADLAVAVVEEGSAIAAVVTGRWEAEGDEETAATGRTAAHVTGAAAVVV